MSSGESEIAESFQTVEELEADALEELGELDQAVQALESGKWTGSISAGCGPPLIWGFSHTGEESEKAEEDG